MTREQFVTELDRQVKLVRTEYGFTQDTMAKALGLSKKTLVQIEKGRASLGWTGAVALSTVFADSQVLAGVLGGEGSDMVRALAFADRPPRFPRTMGGKVWWRTAEVRGHYRIQQNILSQHYRLLDGEDRRLGSSFDLEQMRALAEEAERRRET